MGVVLGQSITPFCKRECNYKIYSGEKSGGQGMKVKKLRGQDGLGKGLGKTRVNATSADKWKIPCPSAQYDGLKRKESVGALQREKILSGANSPLDVSRSVQH